jgi:capsid portal protein
MEGTTEKIKGALDSAGLGHLDVRVVKFVDRLRKADDPVRAPVSGEETPYMEPPLSIPGLFAIVVRSAALRPNIDAYCTNIDGFGHRIKPRFGDDDVKAAVEAEVLREEAGLADKEKELEAAVEARMEKWRADAAAERVELERFWEHATVGMSVIALRKRTRWDLEASGDAYWEVARGPKAVNDDGEEIEGSDLLAGKIYHAPAKYMRLCPALDELTIEQQEQINALEWRDTMVRRRFRKYTYLGKYGIATRYLKEFGDKRVLSSASGQFYESLADLHASEGKDAVAANEVVHFSIYAGDLGYGEPRWGGALLDVLGSISVSEVNYLFFEEGGGVPEIAICVSGARLGDGSAEKVEEVLAEHRTQRTRGFHRALVLEAVPVTGAIGVQPKVTVIPLRGGGGDDLTFNAYDEKNFEKVGMQFRIPKILRGDTRDFNRATAEASISYAESQVFAGERMDFDWFINKVFLVEAGIKWHDFVSLGPQVHDLEGIAAAMSNLKWLLRPMEGRRYITNNTTLDLEELDPEKEEWILRPLEVTLAGRGFSVEPTGVVGKRYGKPKRPWERTAENEE